MDARKDPLVNNHYYHIYSRSIAKFIVFNDAEEYNRFLDLLELYRYTDFIYKYADFLRLTSSIQETLKSKLIGSEKIVEIIAYCLMPTHFHLILKQVKNNGISIFMSKILNSYAKYFNARHQRNGPLWAGKFKNVLIASDEQILHLSRYIHLNPTSAGIAKNPKDWSFSSLKEYIKPNNTLICDNDIIELKDQKYLKFVNDHKDYQKSLSLIKSLIIDDYSG